MARTDRSIVVGRRMAHPEEFQQAKEHTATTVANNTASRPLDPEDAPQLLS